MSVFIIGVILTTVALLMRGRKSTSTDSGSLDYRCNGHYTWDIPSNGGRTDRNPHHAEGNAYKVDEHKYY
jgi:hypothetical protein